MGFKHLLHKHDLTLIEMGEENHDVRCSGCMDIIYGPAYICTTCDMSLENEDDFAMHKSCAELPPQIQRDGYHPHALSFCFTIMIVCDGCGRLRVSIISYTCIDCLFNLCCGCACTIAFSKDESEIAKHEALEGRRIKTTIHHFSHIHQLTRCWFFLPYFTDEDIKPSCVACKKNLHGTVSYICLPCTFLLHESCVNDMPMQVQSPFHPQHILLPRAIRKGSSKICNACMEAVTGISFCCNKCDVIYHVSCAKYQTRAIKHNCHPHYLLQYGKSIISGIYCQSCHRSCSDSSFSGRMCDFDIHLECIPLQPNVKHRHHSHPLVLTIPFVEDDLGEFYCDMCEKKRNTEHHIYYCEECNYIGHIDCAISEVLEVETTEDIFLDPQRMEENSSKAEIAMEDKMLESEGILVHYKKYKNLNLIVHLSMF
ncbi:hypothetical protein DITRI_Ditri09bG0065000 [Diplodiscus trichospermus]